MSMLKIKSIPENNKAKTFCNTFVSSNRPKYIFGRNAWAESIANIIDIDGFIDEFTHEKSYLGKPVVPIEEIPDNALVVSIVQGKPFMAEKSLRRFQFDSLDYYAFFKYAGLPIKQIMFWDGMAEDIRANLSKYNWIYTLLKDKTSKNQFFNIINFRISYDLDYMRGFENIEEQQYFEDFLQLSPQGESFADIGAFDGYTTKEFIKRCPDYQKVFLFEPEEKNMETAKNKLVNAPNIQFFQLGLSDRKETLKFDVSGSSSKISEDGALTIYVDRLDDLVDEKVTFIKMDIEGYEQKAIEGAKKIIQTYHPRLAISVYHQKNDFWKIPELILNIRTDYDIYLRHYTEGISETIMFFIPSSKTTV